MPLWKSAGHSLPLPVYIHLTAQQNGTNCTRRITKLSAQKTWSHSTATILQPNNLDPLLPSPTLQTTCSNLFNSHLIKKTI